MVTRLYFHATSNGLSNLPTSEQSSLTANANVDAQNVNRLMDTTIGTGQQGIALTSIGTTSLQRYYFTRFVSQELSGVTSITAQSWTYNYATGSNAATGNFPAGTASSVPVRITCYVWRPSTQTKVGDILDGTGGLGRGVTAERAQVGTFSGGLVSGIQDGDVICFEVWFEITQATAGVAVDSFYYDGTTVGSTNFGAVTNHASFIETPQTLTFGATLTRVSDPQIYKYKLLNLVSLSRLYKYNILVKILSSRIYRYALQVRVSLSRLYKYNLIGRITLARIYRYKLQARLSLSRIYKYAITAQVLSSRIFRYKITGRLSDLQIYRYGINSRLSLARIYRYGIKQRLSDLQIYRYKLQARISLGRIYRYNIFKKVALARIYSYKVIGRVLNPETYRYNLLNRFTASRIYRYRLLNKITLSRIYKYKLFGRLSLLRIYRYKLLTPVLNPETYRYQIAARVSLSRIYSYGIISTLLRAAKSNIYRYNIKARLGTTRTFKYNLLNKITLSRIYKYNLFQVVGAYHLAFDGINDYVQLGNDVTLWSQALTKFSFSFWVMQDVIASGGSDDIFVNHCNLGTFPANRFVCNNSFAGHLEFTVKNAANASITARFSNAAVPEIWQHIVCVYDNSLGSQNVKIYVNGVLGNTTGNLTETITLAQTMQLGDNSQPLQGMMKDFRWWTTIALNQPKVTALYNAGANNTNPIVNVPDYWLTMEERDSSGNAIDRISGTKTATLQNGTFWMGMYPATGRVQAYKYNLLQKLAISQTYLYRIFQKAAKAQNYIYNILQRIGIYSVLFDGVNDYINCGNDISLWSQPLTKFSFSIWINPNIIGPSPENRNIVDHGWANAHSFLLYNVWNTSRYEFTIRTAASVSIISGGANMPVTISKWDNIVCTYDSTLGTDNIKMYLNGVQCSVTGNLTEILNRSSALFLGGLVNEFGGNLRDFRWFTNKALTQAEINNIINNPLNAPTPDYWLKLDEGQGNPKDSISGTKTATLTNGASWFGTGSINKYIYQIIQRISNPETYRYAITGRILSLYAYVYNILQRVGRPLAIHFDGVDDGLVIGSNNAVNNLDNFSISCWIYPTATSGVSTAHVFIKRYASNNSFILYFSTGSFTLNFRTINNTAVGVSSSSGFIQTDGGNKWYHVLVTFNRATGLQQLFINGILRASGTNTGCAANQIGLTDAMSINNAAVRWTGDVKDFRLWRSELTQADIDKVYSNDSTAILPDYWLKMEDTPTTTTVDSINGFNAVLVGGATRILSAPVPWLAKTQKYLYNIFQKVPSLVRTYRYRIFKRIMLPRIYKYNILIPALLQQIYRYKISARTRLTNIYRYKLRKKVFTSWTYIYNTFQHALRVFTYRYNILVEVPLPWSVAGKLTDFPDRVDNLVISYVIGKWSISDPPVATMIDPYQQKNQTENINIGSYDYDKFRSYYIRVKEQPARIVNKVRPNLMEFNQIIDFKISVRRLSRGEAFSELQNIINELIRIWLIYQQQEVWGIQAISFESLTPLQNKETVSMNQSNKTVWEKSLKIILHYHKVKRVEFN